jgi:hypothetical protein
MDDKRTISAKAVVTDMRTGMSAADIMAKYELSPSQWGSVTRKLLERGYVTQQECDACLNPSSELALQQSAETVPKSPATVNPYAESTEAHGPSESRLLSEYARSCLQPARERGGFWWRLCRSLHLTRLTVSQGQVDQSLSEATYCNDGYEPFCQVRDLRILIRKSEDTPPSTVDFICLERGVPQDVFRLAKAFVGERPVTWLLLLVIFTDALSGDATLSLGETEALAALANCFELSAADLSRIRATVYQRLVHAAILDRRLEAGEQEFLRRARTSLGVPDSDRMAASYAALHQFFCDLSDAGELRENDVSALTTMIEVLGVDRSSKAQLTEMVTLRLFIQECREGRIPVLPTVSITLKPKEVAYFESPVDVYQQKTITKTHRGYAGTRIMIGKVPLYLGGSTPFTTSHEEMVLVGDGDFYITDQRVVLTGTKVNYSIPISKINDVEFGADWVQIMDESRYGGRYYKLPTETDATKAKIIMQCLRK